jgi:hypothetical protein
MTVLGGYLGAGKTISVNELVAGADCLRRRSWSTTSGRSTSMPTWSGRAPGAGERVRVLQPR